MKGKQAAASSRAQLAEARAHIDRLTDQLAEAKLRARQVEAAAAVEPALRRRVAELERRCEDVTAPKVVALVEAHRAEVEEWKAALVAALALVTAAADEDRPGTGGKLLAEEWDMWRRLSLKVGDPNLGIPMTRLARRNLRRRDVLAIWQATEEARSKAIPV